MLSLVKSHCGTEVLSTIASMSPALRMMAASRIAASPARSPLTFAGLERTQQENKTGAVFPIELC